LFEIAIVDREFCLFFGISGVLSRSIMLLIDARLLGYESYSNINYCIFLSSNGDCIDRYLLRFNEILESCRIIYSIIWHCLIMGSFNPGIIMGTALLSNNMVLGMHNQYIGSNHYPSGSSKDCNIGSLANQCIVLNNYNYKDHHIEQQHLNQHSLLNQGINHYTNIQSPGINLLGSSSMEWIINEFLHKLC